MTFPKFLCDKNCSFCGLARMKQISDGKNHCGAPVIKDAVLQCLGCGSTKSAGLIYEEVHSRYHEMGEDPLTGYSFKGAA